MTTYVLAPEAERDLNEIWDYIAADDVGTADRVMGTLFAAFAQLAAMPGLRHTRTDLTDLLLRFWTVGAYVVIYRAERTPLEIIVATRGGRDIPRFLRRRQRGRDV
jgi:toxin ParE1/3/4